MGKNTFSKPFGNTSVFNNVLKMASAGIINPAKGRLNIPLSGAQMRDWGSGIANTYTGGALDKPIGQFMDSKTGRLLGNIAGAVEGAVVGGAASSALGGAAGAGNGAASAAPIMDSSIEAAAMMPAATSSGAGAAAGTAGAAGGSNLATNLATGAALAGAGTNAAGLLMKPKTPSLPDAPTPPTMDNTAAQQSDAENQLMRQQARRTQTLLTSGQGSSDYGQHSFAPTLLGNNTYLKSVLG